MPFYSSPTRVPRLAVLVGMVAAICAASGCGGSGGGGTTPPPPNTSVVINLNAAPAAVAEKIGDGSWTAASAQGTTLTVSLPSGVNNFGIALVCSRSASGITLNQETILEATTADPIDHVPLCLNGSPPNMASLTGSVDASAIAGASAVRIDAPGGGEEFAGASGTFSVQAQTGTDDIAFLAMDISGNVVGIKIVRSQAVPGAVNNGNVVTFLPADAATSQTLTVANLPAGFTLALPEQATYHTTNGGLFSLSSLLTSGPSTQYAAVPASEAQTGDSYEFQAEGAESQSLISSRLTTATAGAVSLTMPAPLPLSAPAAGSFPSFAINYSGSGLENYFASLRWLDAQNNDNFIVVNATANYQAGSGTISIPDLTTIPGFVPPASSGTTVYWTANVGGGSYGTTGQATGTGTTWVASTLGSYTEP